jgi:hypothetical protein
MRLVLYIRVADWANEEYLVTISNEARNVIGWIIITVPTIEFGGVFLLYLLRKQKPNGLKSVYYRAGHAHAGVLVLLSILAQLLIDVAHFASPGSGLLRIGFFLPPILISAGFFLGAPGESGKPGPLLNLVYLGAALLAVSSLALGIGLVFGNNG